MVLLIKQHKRIPDSMERIPIGKIEIMPVVDRVVDVGLWIGRLFTSRHFDSVVDMYDRSDWTPVQQDAAQWMDRIDLEDYPNETA